MDEIVLQAMAKWPNVPHCFGWLELDARGYWRMRDEAAQAGNLPGERVVHPALIAFINRNYTHDDKGRWYFQNGPQRVYVDLEVAPLVAHLTGDNVFKLHTGGNVDAIEGAWFSEEGKLLVESAGEIALVDDRDLGACVKLLRSDDKPISDADLSRWFEGLAALTLTLAIGNTMIEVGRIESECLERRWHFVKVPKPDLV